MRDLGDRTRVAREVLEVAGSFEGPRR
jgi:hypothetical protein